MKKLITTFFLSFFAIFSIFTIEARAQISGQEQQNIINIQNQILQRQGQIERDLTIRKELKQVAKEKKKIIKEEREKELRELEDESGKIIQNYHRIQCFRIKEVIFLNNKIISESSKSKLVQGYSGQCLTLDQISDLADNITDFLVADGYITSRAEIPPQNLHKRVLSIKINEAYLENIIFNENDFLDKVQRFSAFGHFTTGQVLNIKPIEAALDQVNRLQSSNATIKLLPGAKEGHSIVLIETNSEKPAHFNFAINNHGNDRTGARSEIISFAYDNLLQLNDVFTLRHSANNLDKKRKTNGGTNSISSSISIPFFSYNFGLSYSSAKYFFRSGEVVKFKSSGDTSTTTLSVDKVFSKTKKNKFDGKLSLTRRYNRSFTEGKKLDASSRKASFLTADFSQTFFLKNATLFTKESYSKSTNVFDSQKNPANISRLDAHSEFDIIRFYGHYSRQLGYFKKRFTHNMIVNAQQSSERLYGIDQFSVGGFYSVRGFQNSSISGDGGYNIRNELSIGLSQLISSKKVNLQRFTISPFYDYGYVRSKGGRSSGRLGGAGLRVNFYHQYFDADVTFSKALSRAHLLQGTDFYDDEAVFFNISSRFSI
jgi:hemolysin activation/secretion protein